MEEYTTYYKISTGELMSLSDNLGHDYFVPIQCVDGDWLVTVPFWYGNAPFQSYIELTYQQAKQEVILTGTDITEVNNEMFFKMVNLGGEQPEERSKTEEKRCNWFCRLVRKVKNWFKNIISNDD